MKKRQTFILFSLLLSCLIPLVVSADSSLAQSSILKIPSGYLLDQIKGTVLILPKGSQTLRPAEEDQTLQAGDKVITRTSSEATLTLNPTTMFQVSENSEVQISDFTLKANGGFLSRLKLAAGQILAQVEKLGINHSTFEIEAGGVVCGVRGTAFEVQKDGPLVATNTYEGVVEMDKDGLSQKVAADHRVEFATDQGKFLLQRLLDAREKARFENWQKFELLAARRQAEREEAMKAFHRLPETEQGFLGQKLQEVPEMDRFKVLRRMMREKNLKDRLKVIEESNQGRMGALRKRQDLIRKAAEERARNLKTEEGK